jgi:precorrin-6y C5,15-methyltransferase (decarboxylating) CbiE subunit
MIHCIGAGPGDSQFLTLHGRDLIASADVVAGFDAVLEVARPHIRSGSLEIPMNYRDQTERLAEVAAHHHQGKSCVVVFMGDIHFSGFQFLERVDKACGHPVETVPGISSAQILASRCRVCFDETTFITFHRRGDIAPFQKHLVRVLEDQRNAIVIPRPWDFMPKDIAAHLLASGIPGSHRVEVWEQLTRAEANWSGRLDECTADFTDMSILLIRAHAPFPSQIFSTT